MKTYTYHGPLSGVTLPDKTEVMLCDGHEYPLPETPYIKTLVARRHLVEVPAKAQKAKTQAASKNPQTKTTEEKQ